MRSLLATIRRPQRRRDLIGRLRAVRTVLVVCRGNTCRSPYAAMRLAGSLPSGWEVRHGGIAAAPGAPSPVEAIA
ncbi:MAG TPA: hypothetical protein VFY15_02495, partial [Acidimicrobiia bacterium]|nr:hypothetical protein [Acidimicrobiia bacterium]